MTAGPGTSNVLFGGSGNDMMVAGTGNATMVGGGGGDVFSLTSGEAGGAGLIADFNSNDYLLLSDYRCTAAHNAFANAAFAAGSMTVVLPDNTRITFLGVQR